MNSVNPTMAFALLLILLHRMKQKLPLVTHYLWQLKVFCIIAQDWLAVVLYCPCHTVSDGRDWHHTAAFDHAQFDNLCSHWQS